MGNIQVKNGKAFEYACLNALYVTLSPDQHVTIENTQQLIIAQKFYTAIDDVMRGKLDLAANAATRVITRLEPQLEYPDKNIPLCLSLQTDSHWQRGDVRDVICIRRQNEWEIGLSCKHNHRAAKHPRLSATNDFGAEWLGIPCSREYFSTVTPLFDELRFMREKSARTIKWSDVKSKHERFYVPILRAFLDELQRLENANPSIIAERYIRYLIGKNDFYKVITEDRKKTTRVEAINIAGTLNRPSEGRRSRVNVARLKLPTRFLDMNFKHSSKTTVVVAFDEGWTVSMRMHSAEGLVIPSLKFDVNFVSLPSSVHAQVELW